MKRNQAKTDQSPYSADCMTKEGEMIHPVVQRLRFTLAKFIARELPDSRLKILSQGPGFWQIVTSLAIPCVSLYDMHGNAGPVRVVLNPKDRPLKRRWETSGRFEVFASSFVKTIVTLCTLDWSQDEHLTLIKLTTSVLVQRAVGDNKAGTGHTILPTPPNLIGVRLFNGLILRWLRRCTARAYSNGTREKQRLQALSILQSFLSSKRGWPAISQWSIEKSVEEHQVQLTATAEPLDEDSIRMIQDVVKDIVRPTKSFNTLGISRHAANNNGRANGGVYRAVAGDGFPLDEILTGPKIGRSLNHIAHRVEVWKASIFSACQLEILDQESRRFSQKLENHERYVKIVLILEPGKVRIISVGCAFLNTFLTPIQRHLIDCWKSCPYSTMNSGWEQDVENWVIPDDWIFVSADYKAATDKLKREATLTAMDEVQRILQLEVPTDFEGTEIRYPKKVLNLERFPHLRQRVRQTNGQLMGHVLSFPLLCMINLAGLRLALVRSQELGLITEDERKFILSHTIINGDDLLFVCPPAVSRIFEACAQHLGLTPSVGKSYTSQFFAMVNNVMFLKTQTGLRQLGYINQKLILNISLKDGDKKDSPNEIGHSFNKMFRLCPESRSFLRDAIENRSRGPIAGFTRNFFIPAWLGGFGVDPQYATSRIGMTRIQRQVAAACYEGRMNSFLMKDRSLGETLEIGQNQLVGRLPKPMVMTAGNSHLSAVTREKWVKEIDSDGVESGKYHSDSTSYATFIGAFEMIRPPLADADSPDSIYKESTAKKLVQKLLKRTIQDVKPMSYRKCLESFSCVWLFPQLPPFGGKVSLVYDARFSNRRPYLANPVEMPNGVWVQAIPQKPPRVETITPDELTEQNCRHPWGCLTDPHWDTLPRPPTAFNSSHNSDVWKGKYDNNPATTGFTQSPSPPGGFRIPAVISLGPAQIPRATEVLDLVVYPRPTIQFRPEWCQQITVFRAE